MAYHFFVVISDYKPLESLFNEYSLSAIDNPRVLNYRSRLCDYSFKVRWKKGKDQQIPDALSRAPIVGPDEFEDCDAQLTHVSALMQTQFTEDLILEEIRNYALADKDYQKLIGTLQKDEKVPSNGYVAQFNKIFDELSTEEDLVLRGHRIVIPPTARLLIMS